jgi:hypothetical protein
MNSEKVVTPIGTLQLSVLESHSDAIPIAYYKCDPGLPTTFPPGLSETVEVASGLYNQNKQVFDEVFVGSHPPSAGSTAVYVPYKEFANEIRCAAKLFLNQAGGLTNIELWIPFPGFDRSNTWTSLMALPDLAPVLRRVCILNEGFEANLDKVNVIVVEDFMHSTDTLFPRLLPILHHDMHLHIISPFTTRRFLIETSVPESAETLWQGREILVRVAKQTQALIEFMKTSKCQEDSAWAWHAADMIVQREGSNPDAVKLVQHIRDAFPSLQPSEVGVVSEYVAHKDFTFLGRDLETLMWIKTHVHVYSTFITDHEPGDKTNFYFAHRVPENSLAFISIVPPYKRHVWKFRGEHIDASDMHRPDLMDSLMQIHGSNTTSDELITEPPPSFF